MRERRRAAGAWPRAACFSLVVLSLIAFLMVATAVPGCAQTAVLVPNWMSLSSATIPSARWAATMAYDATTGTLVLFGGQGSSGTLNDTWTWNGSSWTQQSPSTSPPARYFATMSYDASNGTIVLFGGQGNSGLLNDTWTWNGTTWMQQSPSTSPSARWHATMAYDTNTGAVVLFGGTPGGTTYLSDTWTWNGTTWTLQSPATSPSARIYATMAYDSGTGTVVLFGGISGAGYLNDTWTWNGATWAKQSPATSPPARIVASSADDASTGTVVLFGGQNNASQDLNDTWVWNGSTWSQQAVASTPAARDSAAMAYDASTGAVVLFGGIQSVINNIENDTWMFQHGALSFGPPPVCTPSPCSNTALLYFQFTAADSGISPSVVTEGATGLDFTDFGDGSCDTQGTGHSYSIGNTCSVVVKFAPTLSHARHGAVVLKDATGITATAYVTGTGTVPQVAFAPLTQSMIGGGFVLAAGTAVDGSGNVYVADEGNNAVKEMPPGCASSSCVTTLGGGFSEPTGVAVDGSGNIFVADFANSAVKAMHPGCKSSSCVATLGGGFDYPRDVAVDGSGNVYIADQDNSAVKEMPPGCYSSSCVRTLGGGFSYPAGVAIDGSGNVYVADEANSAVKEMAPGCTLSSCVSTLGGGFQFPYGVAVDGSGNVYVGDSRNSAVKEMPPGCASSSCVATLGSGFSEPYGVAVDGSGNVYVADPPGNAVYELNVSAPPNLNFPTATAVGSTDTTDGTLTAQVFNIGNTPLVFSALTYPADFIEASDGNACTSSASLSAGQECDVPVQFAPQNPGSPLSENVTLTNNNLNGTSVQQSIPLSGTAEAPAGTMYSPSPGSTLPSAATTFRWNAGFSGVTGYYLWIGSTPGGYDIANMGPFTGTTATVTLPTNSAPIYVRLWTFINGGATQLENDYTYTEAGPAAITSPAPGSALTSASTTFNWSAGPAGTTAYYLWVGTSPGAADLVNMGPISGTNATVTLPTNGTPIYVRLWTFINGGASQLHNDYTYTEDSLVAGAITGPANNSTLLSASTTFNWSAASGGTASYYLWVGTSPGAADLVNLGPISGNNATVTLPTNGTPIYVRLWTFLNGGATQLENDYTYTEATLAAAAITSPTNGSTLTSASTTFNWSAATGGTASYYLWVGTSPGAADLANIGPLSGTSAMVTLPTNGTPIYVRLWTFINGGATQLENDYSYTEASVVAGVITSPTNGSTLALGPTTFNWSAGSGGALTYYLWVGTSPGAADLANMGPISGTSATVTLPANGTPVYVRLWTFINGGTTQLENDYGYIEAGP